MAVLLLPGQVVWGAPPHALTQGAEAKAEAAARASEPEPPPAPAPVQVNRTVPRVDAPPSAPVFSTPPTAAEISRVRIFEEPLVPIGSAPSAEENRDLAGAIGASLRGTGVSALAPLVAFLRDHPNSSWRASILTNLGIVHRQSGRFTRAQEAWETAWNLARRAEDPRGRATADRALGELLQLHLLFGHQEALETLLEEVGGRNVRGSATEKVALAREGAWLLRHVHEEAVPSGPAALDRVLAVGKPQHRTPPALAAVHGTPEGMSLPELRALSARVGFAMRMAVRTEDVSLALPAIVHLKVGHFSAVIKEENGRYLLDDPILGGPFWMTRETLNEETSGYFLIPDRPLGPGWREATAEQAAKIRGKCLPQTVNAEHVKRAVSTPVRQFESAFTVAAARC